MEGHDRPNPLDLVDVAASLGQWLAEQCLSWALAKQKQPLGLCQADVPPGDLSAFLAI